jgi:hypothetical protein
LHAASSDQRDVVSIRHRGRELPPRGPHDAPGSVAQDRPPDAASGHERDLSRAGSDKQYHPVSVKRPARREHATDVGCARRGSLRYAESRERPLARRRAMIDRPARVLMRSLNPCRFDRRLLFG